MRHLVDLELTSLPGVSIKRLFAVIVVYKMLPSDSPSLRTLLEAAKQVAPSQLDLTILIQDNTPGGQDFGEIPKGVRYMPAPENPGLAKAYNRALEIAQTEGCEWLLTLDQDTILPSTYLAQMVKYARELDSFPQVAAIVPQVVDQGRNLSPFRFMAGAIPRWFPLGFTGVPGRATYALNSAAVIRVASLKEVGGYDPNFPLDISDINLFHRLYHLGKKVFVAGNVLVNHEFSLLNKNERMSMDRYTSMLLDECAFWDLNMGPFARLERMVRLIIRACKESFQSDENGFRKATLHEFRRRLITPRSKRLAEWERWANSRAQGFVPRGNNHS